MEDDVIDQFYTRYEDDAETSKGSDNNSAAAEPSQFRSLISRANKAGNDNNKRIMEEKGLKIGSEGRATPTVWK